VRTGPLTIDLVSRVVMLDGRDIALVPRNIGCCIYWLHTLGWRSRTISL
jgi:hypothetical protein